MFALRARQQPTSRCGHDDQHRHLLAIGIMGAAALLIIVAALGFGGVLMHSRRIERRRMML
jgi:hypothetical protein